MIYTHAAAAIVGLAIGFAGAWNVQDWRLGAELSDLRKAHARAITTAVQAARDQEQRRIAALTKEAEDAQARELAAQRDADAARGAGDRLRAQLSAARASACRNPGPAQPGEAAGAAERVLADVQRRLDEAADRIARFADLSHSAGLACQRSYEALTR